MVADGVNALADVDTNIAIHTDLVIMPFLDDTPAIVSFTICIAKIDVGFI